MKKVKLKRKYSGHYIVSNAVAGDKYDVLKPQLPIVIKKAMNNKWNIIGVKEDDKTYCSKKEAISMIENGCFNNIRIVWLSHDRARVRYQQL